MSTAAERDFVKFKVAIRVGLVSYLYKPFSASWTADMKNITLNNCQLMGYQHMSFAYNGSFYSFDNLTAPPIRQKLHPDLTDKVAAMVQEERNVLQVERTYVSAYINSVLSHPHTPGDWLKLLPVGLHEELKTIFFTNNDWTPTISQEKIDEFLLKNTKGNELICQRLAINLLL